MTDKPRVPLPAEADIAGLKRELQVNHCRQPSCANFGIPARTEPGGTGPSADRDMRYKVHSTNKRGRRRPSSARAAARARP